MTKTLTAAVWIPRIAGIAMALFLSLFALDAFNDKSFIDALPGFLMHLRPAALVLLVVALSWRIPLAGAVGFSLLALGYAMMVHWRPDWIAVISGPLLVVAVLFLVSARYRPA